MSRRTKILAAATGLLATCFAIVYFAFPGLLLKSYFAYERSGAGLKSSCLAVGDWNIPYFDSAPGDSASDTTDSKPTILFIHGFGDSKENFIRLAKGLTNEYRVVVPDLPGFGQTEIRLDEDYSDTFYADVIAGCLDELQIPSVHLVGYSMGGMLAVKVAARAPSRVRTLTLFAPAGLTGDRPSEVEKQIANGSNPLVYRDRKSIDRLLALNFNGKFAAPEFAVRALLAAGKRRADVFDRVFARLFDPAAAPKFQQQVAQLEMPTLLVWGADDLILSVSAAEKWSELNGNIQVVILEDVGHGLTDQRVPELQRELRAHIAGDP